MEPMYHGESPCFNFASESKVAKENTCDQYEVISFPESLKCSNVLNPGLVVDTSTKDDMVDKSRCECFPAVLLKSIKYFHVLHPIFDVDICAKGDIIDISRCNYVRMVHSESSKYFSPSQKIIKHMKGDVQKSIEEPKIYDEAWLFGKVLWVTILQIAFGLIFNNEGVAKGYQCCFKVVKHLPLFWKGSYFSIPINGHV